MYVPAGIFPDLSRRFFPPLALSLWLCVCLTWVAWLALFTNKCVLAVYITSVTPFAHFEGGDVGWWRWLDMGRRHADWPSISIQKEEKKAEFSPIDQPSHHSHAWGCFFAPLWAQRDTWVQLGAGRRVVALRSWCCVVYNTSGHSEQRAQRDKDCGEYQGVSFLRLSLLDDVSLHCVGSEFPAPVITKWKITDILELH